MSAPRRIVLFDIDGTLTPARRSASPEMQTFLAELRKIVKVAVVGGSDFAKQLEQLGENVLDLFDYSFSENGLVAYRGRELIGKTSIRDVLDEVKRRKLIDFTLRYFADLDIPVKTGTFIEMRTGMFNVSPIGRNCTQEERTAFFQLDKVRGFRREMCAVYEKEFPDWGLKFVIGGQISIDIFPSEWTKVYCLQYLVNDFDEIHFFGDMTEPGGNDYEIFTDPRVIGHKVTGPENTIEQCRKLFFPQATA
jgi:phosphomannomutase